MERIVGVTKGGNKMKKKKNYILVAVILTALVSISASASVEGENKVMQEINTNFQPLPGPKKQPGRAMLFGLGQMLCLTASYWIQKDAMREDWEYQFTWEDQKKRFLFVDGLRFDSNTFDTNWGHSLGGALCYNYGRANRLNPLESFLYGFGVSYFWEFVIEFKEVFSINDMISTSMGGASIGEALFQLGRYFRSRKSNIFNRVLRILSNPVLDMHEWVDGKRIKNQYSFFLGAATAFDLIRKTPLKLPGYEEEGELGVPGFPDIEDKYCIINLFGPTFDLALFQKDLKVRFVVDAYGDFAMIHSHAFKKYSQLYDFGQTKSTLNHGYYYALGVTLSSMLQVNYSNLEFRGKLKYHYFDSIEGMDRFQKDVADEDDFDLKDQRFSYNLSLGYRIPNTPVQLVLGLEQMKRWGFVEDFSQRSTERRSYFQIKYMF
jgi:hypothetical protein